jgi:hypothetical protein
MFRRPKLVSVVLATLSSSALVWAADSPSASSQTASSPSASSAPLTTQQMLDQANAILTNAERAAQTIGQNLRDARRENDVVKSLCLDDKLSQLEVAKLTASERVASLQGSVSSGNTEAVDHDFSVISALGARIGALSSEAGQCIGEEKAAVGQGASLQVIFSPEIPKQDTSSLPSSPNISTPPVAASPVI